MATNLELSNNLYKLIRFCRLRMENHLLKIEFNTKIKYVLVDWTFISGNQLRSHKG